eukprot:scaffold708_cov86-Isochrysis_galbana.AAC.2
MIGRAPGEMVRGGGEKGGNASLPGDSSHGPRTTYRRHTGGTRHEPRRTRSGRRVRAWRSAPPSPPNPTTHPPPHPPPHKEDPPSKGPSASLAPGLSLPFRARRGPKRRDQSEALLSRPRLAKRPARRCVRLGLCISRRCQPPNTTAAPPPCACQGGTPSLCLPRRLPLPVLAKAAPPPCACQGGIPSLC